MTAVLMSSKYEVAGTDKQSDITYEFWPSARRVIDEETFLPKPFMLHIADGGDPVPVSLRPTPEDDAWVWFIREVADGAARRPRAFRVPDSEEQVKYAALVEIDPASLEVLASFPTFAEVIAGLQADLATMPEFIELEDGGIRLKFT